MMMLRLTDESILKWNKYLEDNDIFYNIRPIYTNDMGKILEYSFIERYSMPSHSIHNKDIKRIEPITYRKTYSIEVDKFEIFEKYLLEIENYQILDKASLNNVEYNILLSKYELQKDKHIYNSKDCYRITIICNDLLHNIIYLDECIETAISFFETNINSLYKINDIVSTKKDRSKNFLIINIIPDMNGVNSYEVLEILSVANGIIKYSDIIMFKEGELCYSRDGRISKLIGE